MRINSQEIIDKLTQLKEKSVTVRKIIKYGYSYGYGQIDQSLFNSWRAEILTLIRSYKLNVPDIIENIEKEKGRYDSHVDSMVHHIDALIDILQEGYLQAEVNDTPDYDEILENLFTKFHKIARSKLQ